MLLLRTEGDCGPSTVNRFGKPWTDIPRYAFGAILQYSLSRFPDFPIMSMAVMAPVNASKVKGNRQHLVDNQDGY